ncbi:MAG: HTTM domain-containing protein [Ardenticatenia bacterium]|nr:HTTM domain-containing protein [Ardenticatenia bacterium]
MSDADGSPTASAEPLEGAASLRAFRLTFGLLGLIGALRFFWRGWLRSLYLWPPYHFSYLGFSWLKPWPWEWLLNLHLVLLAAAALALALGLRPRLSAGLYLLLFLMVELWDKAAYLNHYYLVSLLAGLMWAATLRRPPLYRSDGLPDWLLTALRLQLAIVWTFAGLAKLQGDWLLRGLPLRLWLPTRADLPLIGGLLTLPATALAASWAGAFVDLAAAPGLLWRRSRPWALALLWGFHIATGLLFPHIGLFPWYMLAGTTLFLAPNWPRAVADLIRRRAWRCRAAWNAVLGPPARRQALALPASRLGRSAFALYVALQLALPLRHWLYPGAVAWTEEGFRFSWMVLLVERSGWLRYELRDPANGRQWTVDAAEFLTPLQRQQAATQPDMVLEAAHWLAERYRAQGVAAAEVRADAWVSLNGGPARQLIDPSVDLASRRRSLRAADWVLR